MINTGQGEDEQEQACLWVSDVIDGSPSGTAGLLLGDAIVQFGDFKPSKTLSPEETQQALGNLL